MKKIRFIYFLPFLFGCLLPLVATTILKSTGSIITPTGYLIPTGVGVIVGLAIGHFIDRNSIIMERLQKANALLKKEIARRILLEDKYTVLFEHNHSVILVVDPETGAINDANPAAAEFYGYPLRVLKTMNINQINTLSDKETRLEMQKAGKDRRKKFNFKHCLSSGEVRDVEVFSGPINLEGKPYLLSIVNDVTELKRLKGIIPICSHCKQIRDDKGAWNMLEAYISNHSEADFSHGICPECLSKLYPDFQIPEEKPPAQ